MVYQQAHKNRVGETSVKKLLIWNILLEESHKTLLTEYLVYEDYCSNNRLQCFLLENREITLDIIQQASSFILKHRLHIMGTAGVNNKNLISHYQQVETFLLLKEQQV